MLSCHFLLCAFYSSSSFSICTITRSSRFTFPFIVRLHPYKMLMISYFFLNLLCGCEEIIFPIEIPCIAPDNEIIIFTSIIWTARGSRVKSYVCIFPYISFPDDPQRINGKGSNCGAMENVEHNLNSAKGGKYVRQEYKDFIEKKSFKN